MGPAIAFRRAFTLRRDGRPVGARRPDGRGEPGGRALDLMRLAGTGTGYAMRAPQGLGYFARGYRYGEQLTPPELDDHATASEPSPLEVWFDAAGGRPSLKRRHYFDIYHRHLSRFRGQPVHVVEIGVREGGSLQMWRDYFGPDARVSGIDIDPACRELAGEGIEIFIGDQADPEFWARFLARAPAIHIVLDDGGHHAHQQAVTLECLLPQIRPGGVYICEDVGGSFHPFHSFVDGLTRPLSAIALPGRPTPASPLHQHVASVHRYPMVTVIEKPAVIPRAFDTARRTGGPGAQASPT
jgi:hypothetical protein